MEDVIPVVEKMIESPAKSPLKEHLQSIIGGLKSVGDDKAIDLPSVSQAYVGLTDIITSKPSELSAADMERVNTAEEAVGILVQSAEPIPLAWLYMLVPILPGGIVHPLIKIGCFHSTVTHTFFVRLASEFKLLRMSMFLKLFAITICGWQRTFPVFLFGGF